MEGAQQQRGPEAEHDADGVDAERYSTERFGSLLEHSPPTGQLPQMRPAWTLDRKPAEGNSVPCSAGIENNGLIAQLRGIMAPPQIVRSGGEPRNAPLSRPRRASSSPGIFRFPISSPTRRCCASRPAAAARRAADAHAGAPRPRVTSCRRRCRDLPARSQPETAPPRPWPLRPLRRAKPPVLEAASF